MSQYKSLEELFLGLEIQKLLNTIGDQEKERYIGEMIERLRDEQKERQRQAYRRLSEEIQYIQSKHTELPPTIKLLISEYYREL